MLFFASLEELTIALEGFSDSASVGIDQFSLNRFDVTHWVHRPFNVRDVGIFKTAHHVNDRIGSTNMTEKLVAQALTLRGAAD